MMLGFFLKWATLLYLVYRVCWFFSLSGGHDYLTD